MSRIFIYINLMVFFTSCSQEKLNVTIDNDNVIFHGLYYSNNSFFKAHTNLKEFEEIIWKNFYGKEGIYALIAKEGYIDKYGYEQHKVRNVGKISFTELSKYKTLKYFKENNGIYEIVTFD